MRAALAPLAMLLLAGCATAKVDTVATAPALAAPSAITPVSLDQLRGREVLIFPDISVPAAISGVEQYATQCLTSQNLRRVAQPNGFDYISATGQPFLSVMVASVSKSSALGLGGSGLNPDLQEAIAATIQGKPRCAA